MIIADRLLMFRTPLRCSNGHLGFDVFYIEKGRSVGMPPILPKECVCNLWGADITAQSQPFTGLLDRKGRAIYEGDIIETENDLNHWIGDKQQIEPSYKGVVEYKGSGFQITQASGDWHPSLSAIFIKGLRILGNVHQNPELI